MFMKINTLKQKGFTLIELMIVVAIIGILTAIAIPQYAVYRRDAFNAAAETDLRNLMSLEEATYTGSQAYYPLNGSVHDIGGSPTAGTTLSALVAGSSSDRVTKDVGFSLTGGASGQQYAVYTGHMSGDSVFGGDYLGTMRRLDDQVSPGTVAQNLNTVPISLTWGTSF